VEYGQKCAYTSLWQKVSYRGKSYYAPYDELDFSCSGGTIIYNTSNINNLSVTDYAKDIGIGYGITTKIEAPVYGKGIPYTWTMKTDPNFPGESTYIARIYQNSNHNKYIALDYGYNIETETANLHLNKPNSGLYNDWGIIRDHEVIGPKDIELKINGEPFRPVVSETYGPVPLNAAKGLRYLGTAALVIGAAADAYNIYIAEDKPKEATRVAGGWAGAYVIGEAGVSIGATIGVVGGPIGVAAGGLIGGIAGGAIGYYAGSEAGEIIYDKAKDFIGSLEFW
jgi:hypothetical protein